MYGYSHTVYRSSWEITVSKIEDFLSCASQSAGFYPERYGSKLIWAPRVESSLKVILKDPDLPLVPGNESIHKDQESNLETKDYIFPLTSVNNKLSHNIRKLQQNKVIFTLITPDSANIVVYLSLSRFLPTNPFFSSFLVLVRSPIS